MKSCWHRNNTLTNAVKDLSWFYFVVVVVALTAFTRVHEFFVVATLDDKHQCLDHSWQKKSWTRTQKRRSTAMLCLYIQAGMMRMIKQLCIAGWSEQGGVEEGEASTVHDPQVLQGEILFFNKISECITYDIWYHDLQVHIFHLIQSLCSTYTPLFEWIRMISQGVRILKYSTVKLYERRRI